MFFLQTLLDLHEKYMIDLK